MRWWCVLGWIAWGCAPPDEPSDPAEVDTADVTSACGEVTEGYDVTVLGLVHLRGEPAPDAEVRLLETNWDHMREYGSAVTAADGTFELQALDLVSVEDCWGTAVDYSVVATWSELQVERDVNSHLFRAIDDGSFDTDLSELPLELDP